jgi:hypothetical protein
MVSETRPDPEPAREPVDAGDAAVEATTPTPGTVEIGGRDGPDPTRYGDWEKNGRCIDF